MYLPVPGIEPTSSELPARPQWPTLGPGCQNAYRGHIYLHTTFHKKSGNEKILL